MSLNNESLAEALTNNTFDIKSTDKAIELALNHSYSYLSRLQKSAINYEEYYYSTYNNMSDDNENISIFLDKKGRFCINIHSELMQIHKKERYKRSPYYDKEISLTEFNQNRELFKRFPILIMDNKVETDYKIKIYDDHFVIITRHRNGFMYDFINYKHTHKNHKFSIHIINNYGYFEFKTNFYNISNISTSKGMKISSIKNILHNSNNSDIVHSDPNDGCYFAMIYDDSHNESSLIEVETTNDDEPRLLPYFSDTVKENFSGKDFTIRFIYFKNLHKHIGYRNSSVLCRKLHPNKKYENPISENFLINETDFMDYDMAIPKENLLLFKVKKENSHEGSYSTYKTSELFPNVNVNAKYGNIFRVENDVEIDDQIIVYYFYYENMKDFKFTYMYKFYMKYLTYKWGNIGSLEAIINKIYFADFDLMKHHLDIDYRELEEIVVVNMVNILLQEGTITEDEVDGYYNFMMELYSKEDINIEDDPINLYLMEKDSVDIKERMPKVYANFVDVFNMIIDSNIFNYQYDDIDYVRNYSGILHTRLNPHSIHPLEYKMNKLKEFISNDAEVLHQYVLLQNKNCTKFNWYINEAIEQNIAKKMMKDDKDVYRFVFKKYSTYKSMSFRIFIDGLLITDYIIEQNGTSQVVYIPSEYITKYSSIEIEIFPQYIYDESLTFSSVDDVKTISIMKDSNIKPTIRDISIFDTNNPSNYYELDNFEIYFIIRTHDIYGNESISEYKMGDREKYISHEEVGELISVLSDKNNRFTYIDEMRIKPKNEEILNKDLTFRISKKSMLFFTSNENDGEIDYPIFDLGYNIPDSSYDMNNYYEHIRIFKNGKLQSRNSYHVYNNDGMKIQVLQHIYPTDNIVCDLTPFTNRLVYFNAELNSGFIDLRKYIDKPFDLKYYDVYLNGRRLSKDNIFIISPWYIKLCNIHSIYNLEIYEKDRDWEYYGYDYTNYYTLGDLLISSFMQEDIEHKIIDDIIGVTFRNLNDEKRQIWERDVSYDTYDYDAFYYLRLVTLLNATGDINQFNITDIFNQFNTIYTNYRKADKNLNDVLLLSPDVYVKGDDTERWNVYKTGQDEEFFGDKGFSETKK